VLVVISGELGIFKDEKARFDKEGRVACVNIVAIVEGSWNSVVDIDALLILQKSTLVEVGLVKAMVNQA
jgi:hypothetical protein